MSQARKTLKKIATGEEYKALVAAIEKADYQTIFNAYTQLSRLVEEAEKEVQQGIQSLTRRNKEEDYQKFKAAYNLRISTLLPQWHWLNTELEKQKIKEGIVLGLGTKGDPLARTPEGRVVVVRGAPALKEGDKVRFKVVAEGEKIDFGRVCELSPELFYSIFSQGTREKIINSLDSLRERIFKLKGHIDENSLTELSDLLKELEQVRELAAKLQPEEKEKTIARVLAYRRRLLETAIVRLALNFISREEEREIKECCSGDGQPDLALSAPGLFRQEAHQRLKSAIMAGQEPRGYAEIVGKMEKNLNSMSSALELMEFKTGIEKTYPMAQKYLERMDRLFWRLSQRARQLVANLAEDKVFSVEDIQSAIKNAFSSEILSSELRRSFRSPGEFATLRGALVELKTKLGDKQGAQAETAIKPYLRRRIDLALKFKQ